MPPRGKRISKFTNLDYYASGPSSAEKSNRKRSRSPSDDEGKRVKQKQVDDETARRENYIQELQRGIAVLRKALPTKDSALAQTMKGYDEQMHDLQKAIAAEKKSHAATKTELDDFKEADKKYRADVEAMKKMVSQWAKDMKEDEKKAEKEKEHVKGQVIRILDEHMGLLTLHKHAIPHTESGRARAEAKIKEDFPVEFAWWWAWKGQELRGFDGVPVIDKNYYDAARRRI